VTLTGSSVIYIVIITDYNNSVETPRLRRRHCSVISLAWYGKGEEE